VVKVIEVRMIEIDKAAMTEMIEMVAGLETSTAELLVHQEMTIDHNAGPSLHQGAIHVAEILGVAPEDEILTVGAIAETDVSDHLPPMIIVALEDTASAILAPDEIPIWSLTFRFHIAILETCQTYSSLLWSN
jgi:hypothetical protein